MWTVKFWKQAAERAVKSFLQGLIVFLGISDAGPLNLAQADLKGGALAGVGMTFTSVVFSLLSAKLSGDEDDPSLVSTK